MDPQMRQIHAQLAGMLGRGGADRGEGGEAPAGSVSDALVRQVFADPRADGLLRKVMTDNKLPGAPHELPFATQRAIVEMLVRAGAIGVGDGEGEGGGQA
jgi:hypothetical protein